jgi:hypothetical protein
VGVPHCQHTRVNDDLPVFILHRPAIEREGIMIPLRASFVLVFVLVLGLVATGAQAYVAHLSGGQAIPPVNTHAQGTAIFELSADGSVLGYRVVVNGVSNVTQVQIRLCVNGDNGYPVASLLGAPGGTVAGPGVNARGVLTAANLQGPLAGRPLSALINSIQNGVAFVTVSTSANPPGEVRGQIR